MAHFVTVRVNEIGLAKKAEAMVAGDPVLFEAEVNPVMSIALDAGLIATVPRSHYFFDEPKVYFMHIGGKRGVEKLACGAKTALAKQKEIQAASPQPTRMVGRRAGDLRFFCQIVGSRDHRPSSTSRMNSR